MFGQLFPVQERRLGSVPVAGTLRYALGATNGWIEFSWFFFWLFFVVRGSWPVTWIILAHNRSI
jgi:hypothetical protein